MTCGEIIVVIVLAVGIAVAFWQNIGLQKRQHRHALLTEIRTWATDIARIEFRHLPPDIPFGELLRASDEEREVHFKHLIQHAEIRLEQQCRYLEVSSQYMELIARWVFFIESFIVKAIKPQTQ